MLMSNDNSIQISKTTWQLSEALGLLFVIAIVDQVIFAIVIVVVVVVQVEHVMRPSLSLIRIIIN